MDKSDTSLAGKLRGALEEAESREAVKKRVSKGGKLSVDEILQQMTCQLKSGKRAREAGDAGDSNNTNASRSDGSGSSKSSSSAAPEEERFPGASIHIPMQTLTQSFGLTATLSSNMTNRCNGGANIHVALEQRLSDVVAQAAAVRDKVEESRRLVDGTAQTASALLTQSWNVMALQTSSPVGSCAHVLNQHGQLLLRHGSVVDESRTWVSSEGYEAEKSNPGRAKVSAGQQAVDEVRAVPQSEPRQRGVDGTDPTAHLAVQLARHHSEVSTLQWAGAAGNVPTYRLPFGFSAGREQRWGGDGSSPSGSGSHVTHAFPLPPTLPGLHLHQHHYHYHPHHHEQQQQLLQATGVPAIAPFISPVSMPVSLPVNMPITASPGIRVPAPVSSSIPRSLNLSAAALNSMGTAVRPLAISDVRALTLVLTDAVAADNKTIIGILLKELQAASCPVGPAPQRMAHLFATVLASRVAGDAWQRYLAPPPDPQAIADAYLHHVNTPVVFFLGCCATVCAVHALIHAHRRLNESALASCSSLPVEHIHIIDINIETSSWLFQLLRHLASRPRGAPQSLHITILDVLPRVLAAMSVGRSQRFTQLKEQLTVQAVTAGVEKFECEVVSCVMEEVQERLGKLRLSEKRERMRRAGAGVAGGTWKREKVPGWQGRNVSNEEGPSKRLSLRDESQGSPEGDGERALVDVLFVCNLVRLQDYTDEAVGGGGSSPRDKLLMWIHSLHPDVFLNLEFNHEASGPFLVPRVRESFDIFSAFMHYHDHMFSHHDSSCTLSALKALQPAYAHAEEHVETDEEGKGSAVGSFRMGLPESIVRVAQHEAADAAPNLRKQLTRVHTFTLEQFVFYRTCLNIIALDGPLRYIRPWSHERWTKTLMKHGFAPSLTVPMVTKQVCSMMQGVPDCVSVTSTQHGVALVLCGRDNQHVSIWTVDTQDTALSLSLEVGLGCHTG